MCTLRYPHTDLHQSAVVVLTLLSSHVACVHGFSPSQRVKGSSRCRKRKVTEPGLLKQQSTEDAMLPDLPRTAPQPNPSTSRCSGPRVFTCLTCRDTSTMHGPHVTTNGGSSGSVHPRVRLHIESRNADTTPTTKSAEASCAVASSSAPGEDVAAPTSSALVPWQGATEDCFQLHINLIQGTVQRIASLQLRFTPHREMRIVCHYQ